jgi:hypothetical protein
VYYTIFKHSYTIFNFIVIFFIKDKFITEVFLTFPPETKIFDKIFSLCSDGGGRSGVYLAIDANMELAEEEDSFHVFGYLKKLRQSRKGLIENVVCVSLKKIYIISGIS